MPALTSNPTKWPIRRSSDNLGTVRDLAEYDPEATQDPTTIVDHYVYDAFGNETDHTGSNDFLFKYTGRAFDEETGLQNNLNRWFDPTVGRWLSEDPIGFAAGDANVYRYVGNSSTLATDPSGLETFQIGGEADAYLGIVHLQAGVAVTIGVDFKNYPIVTFGVECEAGGGPAIGLGLDAGPNLEITTANNVGMTQGEGAEFGVNLPVGDLNVSTGGSKVHGDQYYGLNGCVDPGFIAGVHVANQDSIGYHTGTNKPTAPRKLYWPWEAEASWDPARTWNIWFGGQ